MNALRRVTVIIGYEWKRALAKKKFLALVILVFAVQIIIFVVFNHLFTNPPPGLEVWLEQIKPLMWTLEVLAPQGLFSVLIAIMVVGGSMSEEYEQGTADILLSKPITRMEYVAGKYLGGLSLFSFVMALTTVLGVILSVIFFSPQDSLQFIPHVYLAMVYSNLVFLSLAFMFSEALRRTMLALLSTIGVFIASSVISGILTWVHMITGEELYLEASKWLPDWCVSNFPNFVIRELNISVPLFGGTFVSAGETETFLAGALIAVYTIVFVAIAVVRIVRSDVTKKTA
ncbi:ABC transporter permease [Candidatus Bathyarchaeota archaeon]|nr:ABC transporter permease [Candidatus Bathyarchaeota archaeon]